MSTQDLETAKEAAFAKIQEILFNLPIKDDWDKANHILDVLEQLTARIIAGSSLKEDHIDVLCEQTLENIKAMAKEFLAEEKGVK